ncbi:MAG: crotonase/enoyl-CoA hydratase family protein [Deltaproteobacteria bacterium]
MSDETVSYRIEDAVALISLDDGKANALSPSVIEALHGALDQAEKDASAVVIAGRPGRFSGGFDLSIMTRDADSARDLVITGAQLLLRVYTFSLPVVVACTGHAVAAGALMLLSADRRVGAAGQFKIGLNEVAIGMRLPIFALELARDRLAKEALVEATMEARLYTPDEAVEAGYLDRVVDGEDLLSCALEEAGRLASLSGPAYGLSKKLLRADVANKINSTLAEDMAGIISPSAK